MNAQKYLEKHGAEYISRKGGDVTVKYEVILKGSRELMREALKVLYENELTECEHEMTHTEGVDDSRHFDGAGNLIERSNPDIEVCDICGKFYNPHEEEWQNLE